MRGQRPGQNAETVLYYIPLSTYPPGGPEKRFILLNIFKIATHIYTSPDGGAKYFSLCLKKSVQKCDTTPTTASTRWQKCYTDRFWRENDGPTRLSFIPRKKKCVQPVSLPDFGSLGQLTFRTQNRGQSCPREPPRNRPDILLLLMYIFWQLDQLWGRKQLVLAFCRLSLPAGVSLPPHYRPVANSSICRPGKVCGGPASPSPPESSRWYFPRSKSQLIYFHGTGGGPGGGRLPRFPPGTGLGRAGRAYCPSQQGRPAWAYHPSQLGRPAWAP